MTDQLEKESVKSAFRRIRKLRRWLVWILVAYFPIVFLLYYLQMSFWLFVFFCATWICIGIVVAFMIGFSTCPICRQYFHVRGLEGKTFTKECLNCGIRLNCDA
jgi:hypothetical protein